MNQSNEPAPTAEPRRRFGWRQFAILIFLGVLMAACTELCRNTALGFLAASFGIEFDRFRSSAPGNVDFQIAAEGDGFFDVRALFQSLDGTIVFTPTAASGLALDQARQNAYVAIRVPHDPPTYTVSSISAASATLYYFDLSLTRTIQVPITLTHRSEYESQINASIPITDGHSHWETWALPAGQKLPLPPGPFQRPQIAVNATFTFPGSGSAPCWGCTIDIVVANGVTFLGPYHLVVHGDQTGTPNGIALARFEQCSLPDGRETIGTEIQASVPFTLAHCLVNHDTVTHTFDLATSSSQGWNYQLFRQTGYNPGDTVPLTSTQVTVLPQQAFPNFVGILAVYTPTAAVSTTVQETFAITATSTISPAQVRASAFSLGFGQDYRPASAPPPTAPIYIAFTAKGAGD